ncbi:MAG: hypothetical protein AB7P69_24860 [Candidatus Binatia bacterium]
MAARVAGAAIFVDRANWKLVKQRCRRLLQVLNLRIKRPSIHLASGPPTNGAGYDRSSVY